uniref:Leucine rich repeat containing 46 n=1 Tax=Nothoprocta perdicaria TaxID=30464 RepID=A0A8C6ZK98_NOTPE
APNMDSGLLAGPEQPAPGVTLTESLVARRNLGAGGTGAPGNLSPRRSAALTALGTIRLDRENICAIGELQGLREVHSLYLQQNRIERIENLSCLPQLRFLSLSGNRIRKVENLRPLQQLLFLDLSQNQIETLDPDELPRSLRLLDLTGNKCTHQDGYRETVLGALPRLLQLDAQPVPGCPEPAPLEGEEQGSSSGSEDEEHEPLCEPNFFVALRRELAGRSRRRQRAALAEHEARLELLQELQERRHRLPPPAPPGAGTCPARSPGDHGAALAAGSPGQPQGCPHARPGTPPSPPPAAGSQQGLPQPPRGPGRSPGRSQAPQRDTRATARPRAAKK